MEFILALVACFVILRMMWGSGEDVYDLSRDVPKAVANSPTPLKPIAATWGCALILGNLALLFLLAVLLLVALSYVAAGPGGEPLW